MVIAPPLILIIWAPQLFAWIFGPQWHMAGKFARSLIIWLAAAFWNVPAVLIWEIIRMRRFVFFYDMGLLAARTPALAMSGLYLSAQRTVMVFVEEGIQAAPATQLSGI